MMTNGLIGFMFIVFAACMFVLFGWVTAHGTVATECQKLNAFYVGDKVFECRLKEGNKL